MSLTQVCTFRIDGHLFGVPVEAVQEVLRAQTMTRVPLAPPDVRGLINLRGEIVTALDLRRRLSLPEEGISDGSMNVVVRTTHGVVSFLVDEIGDVLPTAEGSFEAPPETLQAGVRELISGVLKLDEGLLALLDVERCVDIGPMGSARDRGKGDR